MFGARANLLLDVPEEGERRRREEMGNPPKRIDEQKRFPLYYFLSSLSLQCEADRAYEEEEQEIDRGKS